MPFFDQDTLPTHCNIIATSLQHHCNITVETTPCRPPTTCVLMPQGSDTALHIGTTQLLYEYDTPNVRPTLRNPCNPADAWRRTCPPPQQYLLKYFVGTNEAEMVELKTRRLFLKRSPCPQHLTVKDFVLGSKVSTVVLQAVCLHCLNNY